MSKSLGPRLRTKFAKSFKVRPRLFGPSKEPKHNSHHPGVLVMHSQHAINQATMTHRNKRVKVTLPSVSLQADVVDPN